jgi:hypothetical protein
MNHSAPQEPIRFGLITAAIRLKPFDDVGVQAHRYGLFRRSVKFADFGPTPIEDWGRIGKINVLVSFCADGSDVSLLFLCELLHKLSFRVTPRRGPK